MPRTAPNPATLEEAREMLLQNTNELNQLDQQIETLNAAAAENAQMINDLRELNQKLFLRASTGTATEEKEEPEPESLEDFAKTLKGVF